MEHQEQSGLLYSPGQDQGLERNGAMEKCNCGSDLPPEPQYDARGIFCFWACDKCRAEKQSHFRPEVFTDANYWHDEPIDDE